MHEITILILIFYTYAFLGWIMEIIESLVRTHKLVNRGFLIGPLCPIYGFGEVLILILLSRYAKDPLVFFIMSIICASIIEYFTSYIMEKIFKNRWWDYSDFKFNINGRICLEYVTAFGFISIISYYGINPILLTWFSKLSNNLIIAIDSILLGLTIIDAILSFNIIITLKNISSTIRSDSTEKINKKVREILKSKNYFHRRLLESFPKMQIKNKMTILKEKLIYNKKALKAEKKKMKKIKKKSK